MSLYKKSFIFFICFISLFIISCKRIPSPKGRRVVIDSKTRTEYYIVQKKDTLYSISRKFGISIDYIQRVNNIKNPNFLNVGQKLYVGKKDIELTQGPDPEPKPVKKQQKIKSKKNYVKNKKIVKPKPGFIILPNSGKIEKKFGDTKNGIKIEGIEIKVSNDKKLVSAASGNVVYVDNDDNNKIIIIEHKNNYYTVYSNLRRAGVKMGDVVSQGDRISDLKAGELVYFELRRFVEGGNPQALDPLSFIK